MHRAFGALLGFFVGSVVGEHLGSIKDFVITFQRLRGIVATPPFQCSSRNQVFGEAGLDDGNRQLAFRGIIGRFRERDGFATEKLLRLLLGVVAFVLSRICAIFVPAFTYRGVAHFHFL